MIRLFLAAAILAAAAVEADEPAEAVPGEAEKAAAVAELEALLADATEKKKAA